MSLNKKLLVSAIAGLLISGNASAVVLGVDPPRQYARELVKPVALTDANDDIEFNLGYNFSGGEVRYGRLECTGNIQIGSPTITETSTNISLGSINGAGTDALFFSITAADPVSGATQAVVLTVDANITLTNNDPVNCAFSIYDLPSQAQAGGTTGRIYTTGFAPFIRSVSGFTFNATPGSATADVAFDYRQFVAGNGVFGSLVFDEVTGVLKADGSQVQLADIFAPATVVSISGDFSAATDLTWNSVSSTGGNASGQTFSMAAVGNGISGALDYIENSTDEIMISDYTALLDAVPNVGYTVADVGPLNAGEILHNGTQLQAPLAQVPGGWISRMVLTNTGSVARPYSIAVQGEAGNTISTNAANMTGTIPANGTVVVDLTTVLTGFTGAPRATLNVTVDAPSNQIQGLYQIVNPASGSISNHVMVRPGSN